MYFTRYLPNILSCLLLIFMQGKSALSMTDKATGISFATDLNELNLFGVGVRRKGPIKVYSVGMYCNETVRESLSEVSRSSKDALDALCSGAEENPTSFVLKMNFKVGAEKMASAIAESVSPRHSVASEVDELKALILSGVAEKGAAVKGTVIQFDCSELGVAVSVDGKEQGSVESTGLAKAFCRMYLDEKGVSQQLKDNILDNCCGP